MHSIRSIPLCATFAFLMFANAQATDRFVSPTGNNNPPYLSWTDAATNIQDAIDAAAAGDVVWVTNGVYKTGGRVMAGDLTNRIALNKALTVQSVNGPFTTVIQGEGATPGPSAVRCAWLTNSAVLRGFTLSAGAGRTSGNITDLQTGGGVWCASASSIVENCVVSSNSCASSSSAAGAFQGTLNHCLLQGNVGHATINSSLNNCTVVNNVTTGCVGGTLTNCIVYFSSGNYSGSTLSYSCTTPLPAGTGNFIAPPQLLPDGFHLASSSPCVAAGSGVATGTDIEGNPWANPPSVGCSQWQPAPVIFSPPFLQFTNNPFGFSIRVGISGQEPVSYFWYRNGVVIENDGHYISAHSTNLVARGLLPTDVGNYQLVASNAFGMVTSSVVQVQLSFRYVDAASVNPVPPYTDWSTAARTIQDAIDVALPGEIVIVTNGVYATGGKVMAGDLTNRVAINKAITVSSVNGATATTIFGAGAYSPLLGTSAVRCAWLTNGAMLNGFTLALGGTRTAGDGNTLQNGGGVWATSSFAVIANCTISNNAAKLSGGGCYQGKYYNSRIINNQCTFSGGGAYLSYLRNCLIYGNSGSDGSGAYQGSLVNCTVKGNSSSSGGGVSSLTAQNCIIYANTPGNNGNQPANATYTCSTPLMSGTGNISAYPQFLDEFHLAATSPCRGAGIATNAWGTDLDGEAWTNPPSMGCDEVLESSLGGPLAPFILLPSLEAVPGKAFYMWASVGGNVSRLAWSFGDGAVSNTVTFPSVNHAWTNLGNYTVTLTAFNNDFPAGVSTNVVISVVPLTSPAFKAGRDFGNQIIMDVLSPQPGVSYTLQITTNLTAPVIWQNSYTLIGGGGRVWFGEVFQPSQNRFYRVWAH